MTLLLLAGEAFALQGADAHAYAVSNPTQVPWKRRTIFT